MKKPYVYPLRRPREDEAAIAELVKKSGQSINSVLVFCIRQGLPLARKALSQHQGRVTLVDRLPKRVLERIYARVDELEGVTAK